MSNFNESQMMVWMGEAVLKREQVYVLTVSNLSATV